MNDMTDFDKLIKEKAGQASYPYDKAAWKQFKRKAGLHGGAAKYWVLGAASIVAVGTFLLLKQGHQAPPPSVQPTQTVVTAVDSGLALQNTSSEVAEDTLAIQEIHAVSKGAHSVSQKNTEKIVEHPQALLKDTSKVIRKVTYGKPIVIDVDTITRMVPTDEELKKGHSRLF